MPARGPHARGDKPDITVKITRPYGALVLRPWLRRVVAETLARQKVAGAEVSLVVTGDERIRDINRVYRRKDAPTDVIAFALTEQTGEEFVVAPDGIRHLGEIVVSYPRAVAQAQERGHSTQRELAILIVHGVLHLLGYDHVSGAEAKRMRGREHRTLAALEAKKLC